MIQNPSLQNRTSTVERNDCLITKTYRLLNSVRSPFFEFLFLFFSHLLTLFIYGSVLYFCCLINFAHTGQKRPLSLVEVLYFTKHIYFFLYSYIMHPYIASLKKKTLNLLLLNSRFLVQLQIIYRAQNFLYGFFVEIFSFKINCSLL